MIPPSPSFRTTLRILHLALPYLSSPTHSPHLLSVRLRAPNRILYALVLALVASQSLPFYSRPPSLIHSATSPGQLFACLAVLVNTRWIILLYAFSPSNSSSFFFFSPFFNCSFPTWGCCSTYSTALFHHYSSPVLTDIPVSPPAPRLSFTRTARPVKHEQTIYLFSS